jgi:hypothetical protein
MHINWNTLTTYIQITTSVWTGTEQIHTYRNTQPHYWNAQQNILQVVITRGTLTTPDDDRLTDRNM